MVRVRDEYRNQIKAYKNLYESSINHGMRRVIESDKKKQKMVKFIWFVERRDIKVIEIVFGIRKECKRHEFENKIDKIGRGIKNEVKIGTTSSKGEIN